ncbi:UvrD-helicase domain-containing protein [Vreelandella rituensis]|nr:UvrD-helicase domain-containing protein [Halomonas rituensis]
MQATQQQQSIVELGQQGVNLQVNALAGTGKTSTLVMLGNALAPRRGLYLAFNKSIAVEAQRKFPSSVKASTIHSLAFRAVGRHYAHRLEGGNGGRLNPVRLLHHYRYASVGNVPPLTRAGLVKTTLNTYLASVDPEVSVAHLPARDISRMTRAKAWGPADIAGFQATLVQDAQRLWKDMLSESSGLPMSHDGYLRLFVDSEPDLGVDFVCIDESQDSSEAMLRLLQLQPCQQIVVGDPNQTIYEWRGAISIMDRIENAQTRYLSQSFRFDNRIAGAANEVLRHLGNEVLMLGYDMDRSRLEGRGLLYRTNSGVFGALMSRGVESKQRLHVAGGVQDLRMMLDAVEQLQRGQATQHPDFIGFDNWVEVEEAAEAYAAPAELRLVVQVVSKFPMKKLRSVLDLASTVKEEDADILVSTAHKFKGREQAEIGLGSDFQLPEINPLTQEAAPKAEEDRLNYVAITRAQRQLYGAKEMIHAYIKRNEMQANIDKLADLPPLERLQAKIKLAPEVTKSTEMMEHFVRNLSKEERECLNTKPSTHDLRAVSEKPSPKPIKPMGVGPSL